MKVRKMLKNAYNYKMNDNNLLRKIESFAIDKPSVSLTFSQRLARENGWTDRFSERVITEYKRFICLVALSKTEVTPSDEIDQAWHLHLTYTHSYWDDLCDGLLGFKLHHLPTSGGKIAQKKYKQQYSDTLSFYEKIFSEKPPNDIWPTVEKRFNPTENFMRINTKNKWVIKKPTLTPVLALLVITPFILMGCQKSLTEIDPVFLFIPATVFYIIYKILRRSKKRKDGSNGGVCSASGGGSDGGGDSGCGGGCGG